MTEVTAVSRASRSTTAWDAETAFSRQMHGSLPGLEPALSGAEARPRTRNTTRLRALARGIPWTPRGSLPTAAQARYGSERMAHILVIEDERDLQRVLEYNLRQAGHQVTCAVRGQEGLDLVRQNRPDLVLLDLMLPDVPGTDVCKALRRDPKAKDLGIVMLTAKAEEIDRVVGFELGADDYVVKPFSVRELLLRIEAVLRRTRGDRNLEPTITFGGLKIDREAHRVWVAGEEIELTALEFRLLLALYDHKNRARTRSALLSEVWGIQADITTRTVDTHVKRLREKLGSAGDYVETVRGVGYRFAENPENPEGNER
jgi:two-component system phosphate regulon response regulator PhoB